MARRSSRKKGRNVDGVIVLDKPAGYSSNDCVQRVKRLFAARKVGHTGSLDPLATGVLPLCLGEATKFSQYLLDSDKRYFTKVRLGVATDSGDADGKVIAERPVVDITRRRIDAALDAFRGKIEQVPSMFSAVKHQGQPLYKLARQGIEVERDARPVTIYGNDIVAFADDTLTLDIHCSKGTYVRTIAHDLGEALGCGAHVFELRRTMAGPYGEADMVSFEQIEQSCAERHADALLRPIATHRRPMAAGVLERRPGVLPQTRPTSPGAALAHMRLGTAIRKKRRRRSLHRRWGNPRRRTSSPTPADRQMTGRSSVPMRGTSLEQQA